MKALARYVIGATIGAMILATYQLSAKPYEFEFNRAWLSGCRLVILQQSNETVAGAIERMPESGGCVLLGDWDQPFGAAEAMWPALSGKTGGHVIGGRFRGPY